MNRFESLGHEPVPEYRVIGETSSSRGHARVSRSGADAGATSVWSQMSRGVPV